MAVHNHALLGLRRTRSAPAADGRCVVACAAVIAFAVAYVLTDVAGLPRPFYLPLEDRWVMAARVSGIAMGYFGLWLWAALASLATATLAGFFGRRRRRPLRPMFANAGFVTALATTLGAIVYWAVRG